jgi:hypothetical protein
MKVQFGMYWQVYGHQTIELPDNIDPKNKKEVARYIKDNWDDIALPSGEYVEDSDELDEDADFTLVY